jgi:hypothetical protein
MQEGSAHSRNEHGILDRQNFQKQETGRGRDSRSSGFRLDSLYNLGMPIQERKAKTQIFESHAKRREERVADPAC